MSVTELLEELTVKKGRLAAVNELLDWVKPEVYQWKERAFSIAPEEFRAFLSELVAQLNQAGNKDG